MSDHLARTCKAISREAISEENVNAALETERVIERSNRAAQALVGRDLEKPPWRPSDALAASRSPRPIA